MSLTDLPPEILCDLTSDLSVQRNLRQVCRPFNDALESTVLSVFPISAVLLSRPRNIPVLEAIVAGRSKWAIHARTLRLRRNHDRNLRNGVEDTEGVKEKLLVQVLAKMEGIHTIDWLISTGEPAWMHQVTHDALGSFTDLRTFVFSVENPDLIQVDIRSLTNLTSLSIRAYGGSKWDLALRDQAATLISSSPNLTAVDLHFSHASWSRTILPSALQRLSTNNVNSDLLQLLQQTSELACLALSRHTGDAETSSLLADEFFASVLPKRAPTLVELSIVSPYTSAWSLGPRRAEELRALEFSKLRLLKLFVASNDLSKGPKDDSNNPLYNLLNLIPHLPVLEDLEVYDAAPEWVRRPARCGMRQMEYYNDVARIFGKAMESFRTTEAPARMLSGAVEVSTYGSPSGRYIFGPVEDTQRDGELEVEPVFRWHPRGLRNGETATRHTLGWGWY
ncbi:F-box domain-containing protein [Mycena kentingensis (nom. inval.)]|nr:F-box domain-containing protein [Mycena kentingensis (nom. inval.)]